jgi:hypothetical protein
MHKENKDENRPQGNMAPPPGIVDRLDELSYVWRELLGSCAYEKPSAALPGDVPVPILDVDPWSALLQANGVEVVDLQHMHLQISDQEVEQLLRVMPDDPDSRDNSPLGASEANPDASRQTDKH